MQRKGCLQKKNPDIQFRYIKLIEKINEITKVIDNGVR